MRKELRKMDGVRTTFQGEFVRFGKKRGWEGRTEETVLLCNVILVETGEKVTDHLWFNYTKGFVRAEIYPGCIIKFDARVGVYKKGYHGRREDVYKPTGIDYRLERPTKIKNLGVKGEI